MSKLPIAISEEIAEILDIAVKEYADKNELNYDIRYHDDPIWIIRDIKDETVNINRLVRRIQIAVYDVDKSLELRIIPDIYYIDAKEKVIKSLTPEKRESYRYKEAIQEILDRLYCKGHRDIIEHFKEEINKVWKDAQDFNEIHLNLKKKIDIS